MLEFRSLVFAFQHGGFNWGKLGRVCAPQLWYNIVYAMIVLVIGKTLC